MNKARVLVADDSSTIQKVFDLAFEKERVEVVLTGDGREAFDKALEIRPDVVIADVNMPGVDGFELCRMIKANPEISSIPVYLLSSALDDFDEELAEEVGAAGKFEKPFRSEDMVNQVLEAVSLSGRTDGGQAEISGSAGLEDSPEKEEDTFEDIDVSLDKLAETAGSAPDEAAEKQAPVPEVLDLQPEAMVEDDVEEDEDLAVEVVLDDEGLDEDEDEAGYEESEADEPASESGEESGAGPVEIAMADSGGEKEPEDGEDEIPAPVESPESLEEPIGEAFAGLSDEAARMLKEIDEADFDAAEGHDAADAGGKTSSVAAQIGAGAEASAVSESRIEEAIKNALSGQETGSLQNLVADSVKNILAERIPPDRLDSIIADAVRDAISGMTPRIMEIFQKVASDITLNVAEDLVRQTIEQIKSGA